MIPPHKTYVEPFAGSAAVYFRKAPSQKEVISDKDNDIAFALRFLRDLTPQQLKRLKALNWRKSRATFDRLKVSKPRNDIERFYRFYYLKKAGFGAGDKSFSANYEGQMIGLDRLPRVHQRLQRTKIYNTDASSLISKYDSADAFFYLDPPYPGRAFIGQTFKNWTEDDLKKLIEKLRHIKGKFALSLGTEHTKLLPSNWHISRVKVYRRIPRGGDEFNRSYQYEIIATNYDTLKNRREMAIEMAPAKLETRPITITKDRGNGHRRLPVGAFSDKKGTRLSRRYHRGWKRVA